MKRMVLLLVMITGCVMGNAQSKQEDTSSAGTVLLVTAKGKTANVRERPDIKAPLLAHWFDEEEKEILRLNAGTICLVLGEENGWYKVRFPIYIYDLEPGMEEGYVSKTVVQESPITTLGDVSDSFMKYDGEVFEYITTTGSKDYPYLYVTGRLDDEAYNYADKETNHPVNLWLGHQDGDVLVFSYPAFTTITMKPNYEGRDKISAGSITFGSTVKSGLDWYPYHKESGMLHFCFDNYGDEELRILFSDAVKNQNYMKSIDNNYVLPMIIINADRLEKGCQ